MNMMMRTVIFETSVYVNDFMQLPSQEYFTEFSCCKMCKIYIYIYKDGSLQNDQVHAQKVELTLTTIKKCKARTPFYHANC